MKWVAPLHLHYMLHYIFAMLHYMSGNDYRVGRKQVSFVVDEALWVAVKGTAAASGVSVTRWLTDVLEREVRFDGSGGDDARLGVSAAPTGGGVGDRPGGGGSAAAGVGAGDARQVVDWDALLAKGRENRVPVMGRASLYDGRDPIEEIA